MKSINGVKSTFIAYREWIRRWKTWPVRPWIKAAALYRSGRFEEAEPFYRSGLTTHFQHPARISALLDLSHCLFRSRQFDEAEACLRQAVFAAPQEREAYIRLARLQLWLGFATEAAWTMRTALQRVPADPELIAIFITAVVECGGISYLLKEVREHLGSVHIEADIYPRLEVAKARLDILDGDPVDGRTRLAELSARDKAPLDGVIAFASLLLDEGKVAYARHHLHRALTVSPEHPRVLTLLAKSYLTEGAFFEPDYAVQLATTACQVTAWRGIHEMHVLAQAYAFCGERISALLVASRAKDTGRRLLGCYRDAKNLDQLIERLSTGTQA